jgi:hypothetical protein
MSIIYAHQRRVSIGQCISDLEFIATLGTDDRCRWQGYFLAIVEFLNGSAHYRSIGCASLHLYQNILKRATEKAATPAPPAR